MRIKIKKRLSVLSIISFFSAFFLVLNCQSVFQNSKDSNYVFYGLCFFLLVLQSIVSIAEYKITKKNIRAFFLTSVLYLFIIFLYVICSVGKKDLFRFLTRFLIFPFVVLFFLSECPVKKKLETFRFFILITAIISIVTSILWFCSSFLNLSPTSIYVWKWSGDVEGYSYFGLYFSSPYQYIDLFPSLAIRRNIGIFTEGPMFMLVLSLALLFSICIRDFFHIKKWEYCSILIAMITTFSVTGYLVVLIIISMEILAFFKRKDNKLILFVFFAVFGIIALSALLILKSSSASFLVRVDDFKVGFKAFLSNPFVGIGYENTSVLESYMSDIRLFNVGFSNSLFAILAYGGILLTGIYVIPIIQGIRCSVKNKNPHLFVFCVVLFLLYLSVIFYTFFINFYIFGWLLFGEDFPKDDKKIMRKWHNSKRMENLCFFH